MNVIIYHNKNNVVNGLDNISVTIPNIEITCIVGHKGAISINERMYTLKELIKTVDSIYYPKFILDKEMKAKKSKKEISR